MKLDIYRKILLVLLITAVSITGGILIFDFSTYSSKLNDQKELLTKERLNQLKSLVDVTIGDYIATRSQEKFFKSLDFMKYDPEGYFYVMNSKYYCLYHPYVKSLLNKDLSDYEDVKGKKFFKELVDMSKLQDEGYIDYYWNKSGKDEPVKKHVWFKKIPKSDMILATGIYSDDLDLLLNNFEKDLHSDLFFRITVIFTIFLIVILTMVSFSYKYFINPIKEISYVAKQIASGKYDISLSKVSNDELGELSDNLNLIKENLALITENTMKIKTNIVRGSLKSSVDIDTSEKSRHGLNISIVQGINQIIKTYTIYFDKMPVLIFINDKDGKILYRNDLFEQTFGNVDSIMEQTSLNLKRDLFIETVERNTTKKDTFNIEKKGNRIVYSIATYPIIDLENNVCGSFNLIKDESTDNSVLKIAEDAKKIALAEQEKSKQITEYLVKEVDQISYFLKKLSEGDLTIQYQPDSFNEDMKIYYEMMNKISVSLEDTIKKLYLTIEEITFAAEDIDHGSTQLSEASSSLSLGSTEQSSSIEELTSTMLEIGSQTRLNAENANLAANISSDAKKLALQGNQNMNDLEKAVHGIAISSGEIKKIIKVIDDIAFQTNLLALNAAVEAARAGIHGKGFAVVADEVRNLAQRSAEAAKETTELIEDSVKRVETGSSITKKSVQSLKEIEKSITKAVDLVNEIAVSSQEQARAIEQANTGLVQVSKITQTNSASSEETADAAKELSSQAEKLKEIVSYFKI
ncbi:MAG: cache domain-containing protein [Candidatus Delongbacteria bacterium]|nr:cache domain-containing protein [Candidatus Delongbacteria bacterium]MBN2835822.1 cache domain-containing protein [Candidatus Delongbacteria bacterium]